jgi:4-azaleucine resistance transporter AzlC
MSPHPSRRDFARGFRAVSPLWLGLVPFAVAFGVMARAAGLSLLEAQLMSVLVFAGGAQLNAASLLAAGSGAAGVVLATLLLNLRHLLYGLTLGRRLPLRGPRRVIAAHLLTDEAFGAFVSEGGGSFAFLLGAELSVFVPWNLATFAGATLGGLLPDPRGYGVDFVFPLAFLAMLILALKGWRQAAVAALAAALALGLSLALPGGLALFLAAALASAAGALMPTRAEEPV